MAAINNSLNLNDRMTPVLRSIMKALDSTLVAMASVDKVSQKAFQQASRDAQNASRAIDGFRTSLTQTHQPAKQSFIHIVEGANQAEGAMDNLISKAKGLLATYLGFQGVSQLVQGGDTFIGNVARLDLMNDGLQTTAQLQQQIYEASQRSLGNYNEMTAAVAKLGVRGAIPFGSSKEIVAFTELLNKQFSIAGASQSEKAGAMYQLTQAMASGRLQGDEFRSILENAPMLAKTIADSMGMNYKQMKEASTKGLITSDIIKKALFSVADETNKKFAEMPMKFGDLWMQTTNKMVKGLEPVYIKLRQMWNNKEFQTFIDGFTNGLVVLLGQTVKFVEFVAGVGSFVAKNWQLMAPPIFLAAFAMGALVAAHIAYSTWLGISTAASAVYTAWLDMQTGGTFAAAAAQYGLNAALLACPITWIVLGIAAIIAIIYLVVAAVNHFAGTSVSATGIIAGVFKTLGAVIWNILHGIIMAGVGLVDWLANTMIGAAEFMLNVINGGFNGFWGTVANFIGNIISLFLDLAKIVSPIIDSIFGTDTTGFLKGLQKDVLSWGKNEDAVTLDRNVYTQQMKDSGFDRMGYGDAYTSAYQRGKDKQQSVKDMFKVGDKTYNMDDQFFKDMQADLAKTAGNTSATAGNTAKLVEGVNLADEDVELLKENARVNFVNKFTTMTPNVKASFGDVRETADVKGIIETLKQSVLDALESSLT